MSEIVGIDGGNNEVKVVGEKNTFKFYSNIGEYRELRLESTFVDKMVFDYKGRKWFGGDLARRESEWLGSMSGDSKAHEELLIRVLLALHRYSDETSFRIVVGQPISKHLPRYKDAIKSLLIGTHEFTLNDVTKQITVEQCAVVAEGAGAFWSNPKRGLIRIIDVGSATVNCVSIQDGEYIDKDSFTIKGGVDSESSDLFSIARSVSMKALKKWARKDNVYVAGGCAEQMIEPFQYHFTNVRVLNPQIKTEGGISQLHPVFANAMGFYNVGRKAL